VDALEFAAGLYRAGCVPPSFLNVGGNEFAQGKLGFFFGAGPNEAMQLKRDIPNLEIGVSPALEHKRRAAYATIGSYAVFAASRHPRETALWLRFLIRPDIMRRFCRATNYIPARSSALPLYVDDPILGAFEREVVNSRPDVKSPHARQIMMRLTPELQAAALGRKTPREALDAAAAEVDAMLEREP
jgi:multiple sugar transport system substrate-binding protein